MTRRLLVLLLLLPLGSAPRAQGTQCEFDGVERIVAIGDVHGAYDQLLPILQAAGIIDDRQRWVGGKTHFVQLGDVLDRGPDSRKVLDLYRRLESQASSAGGRFHYLMGNHEAMRLTGDYRYIRAGEYSAFVDGRSTETKRTWVDRSEPALAALIENQPLGAVEMMLAYASDGDYGRMLRRLNAVVRINGVLFMHGGLSPKVAGMSCRTINDTIRRELTVDLQKTRAAGGAGIASLSFGEEGPLWFRGLIHGTDEIEPYVVDMLRQQNATSIVVAHTVIATEDGLPTSPLKADGFATGRFGVRFGGKVIGIDTGMQPAHIPTGRASALEIKDKVFTAIYLDKREVVVQP